MTSVFEIQPLRTPYTGAREALRTVVETAMQRQGNTKGCLHARLGPATLKNSALVTFAPAHDETRFAELWLVHWCPENARPFPVFDGSISVHGEQDGSAQLEISGDYVPPAGVLSIGFDLTIGQRIASETCKNLLREIAKQIEHRN